MKKLMMAAVALLFTVNMTQAQDQKAATPQPATIDAATAQPAPSATAADGTVITDAQAPAADAAAAKCDMKNCCIKKGGKMFCVKDGKETPMTEDMKMSNGTLVTKDGTCMTKDGKKMMMKDGECMDMTGKSCSMPPAREKAKPTTPAK